MNDIALRKWLSLKAQIVFLLVCSAAFVVGGWGINNAHAQNSLSVSVTPPLIQLSIGPGEVWASELKIVNNNTQDITYYTQVVDFQPQGEIGQGNFVPLLEGAEGFDEGYSLASWISIPAEPLTVPGGQSKGIPLFIDLPPDAAPGGHYAAVLVGTQPGASVEPGSSVSVSSYVSSLIFLRVEGDVVEQGRIREFRANKIRYSEPTADFLLRFENTGNTHLQPQGDITIYNMWGKERGRVSINQGHRFGNVLPNSVRKFEFSWNGAEGAFDVGRYSAVATVAYGQDNKRHASATTYFWVIPLLPISIGLAFVAGFLFIMTWFIRRYIQSALALERKRMGHIDNQNDNTTEDTMSYSLGTLAAPLKEGVIDLRRLSAGAPADQEGTNAHETSEHPKPTFFTFIRTYKLFFLFLIVATISVALGWRYFDQVLTIENDYSITDVRVDGEGE